MNEEQLQRFLTSAKLTLNEHGGTQFLHKENLPPIQCRDGFSMSVQASHFHYCKPRASLVWPSMEPYTHVEVGFPSKKEDLLMPYAEDPDSPTETVYGYVPTHIVLSIIENHGGKI